MRQKARNVFLDEVELTAEEVHGWNTRQTMLTPHQILAAWGRLRRLGWLDVPIPHMLRS